jgi:hypothetical protein
VLGSVSLAYTSYYIHYSYVLIGNYSETDITIHFSNFFIRLRTFVTGIFPAPLSVTKVSGMVDTDSEFVTEI